MSKPTTLEPALRREEWDFSSVPEVELEACLRYELAREIKDYALYFFAGDKDGAEQLMKERRSKPVKDAFLKGEEYFYVLIIFYERYYPGSLHDLPEGYPNTPWLKIPQAFRTKIISHKDARIYGVETTETYPTQTENQEREYEASQGRGIARLRIDWKQSDAAIAADFRLWLQNNRPKNIAIQPARGKQFLRDDLNALSAMRLRHHYTPSEAMAITEETLGSPLYSAPFSWDRAAWKAVKAFYLMFPEAGGPLSSIPKKNPRGRPTKAQEAARVVSETLHSLAMALQTQAKADPSDDLARARTQDQYQKAVAACTAFKKSIRDAQSAEEREETERVHKSTMALVEQMGKFSLTI